MKHLCGAAAVAAAMLLPGTSGAVTPLPSCSKGFVKQWVERDRRSELPIPERTCLMQTETGSYVCSRNGCVRP